MAYGHALVRRRRRIDLPHPRRDRRDPRVVAPDEGSERMDQWSRV